jgi:4a-hydroxytetrahydrobiopterin dehydratase
MIGLLKKHANITRHNREIKSNWRQIMNSILATKKCTPCQGNILPMTIEDANKLMNRVPGWILQANATKIERTFKESNFMGALSLAQKIGALCEAEGHHPDITLGWGYCTVVFQTHKINGLHENDFIMAAKTNRLFEALGHARSHMHDSQLKKAA